MLTEVVVRRDKPQHMVICKDGGEQLITDNISPLRPRPGASKNLSSIVGRFDTDKGNHSHMSETELLLRANNCQANLSIQVMIKFM